MEKKEIIEKKKKERFKLLAVEEFVKKKTGIQIKVEPEAKLSSAGSMEFLSLGEFYRCAKKYCEIQWEINQLLIQQNKEKEKIIKIVKFNNDERELGLRGIISEKDNFNLTVFPSVHNVFDQNKLQKGLDVLNSMGLIRNISMSFCFAPTAMPDEHLLEKIQEIEQIIKKDLTKMGIFYELVPMETNIKVDEKGLNKEIDNKKIKLLPGTKKSEITWKVLPKKHH